MKKPAAAKKPQGHKQPAPAKNPAHTTAKSSHLSGFFAQAGKMPQAKKPPKVSKTVQHQRHMAAVKAAKTRAANAKAAHKKPSKPRQLALGGGVACCSAEALAASLRLTGHAVEPADVLALYRCTADCPDAGAPIVAVLEAAAESGLAGARPVSFAPVDIDDPAAVILGLALPAPHAVTATPDGWWSWGELYSAADFPGAVIEEAWAVTW